MPNKEYEITDCDLCTDEKMCEDHCKEQLGHNWDGGPNECTVCGGNWAEINADNYSERDE